MATEEDLEKKEKEEEEESSSSEADEKAADDESTDDKLEVREKPDPNRDSKTDEGESEAGADADDASTPVQLGYQRYVYAAYMAGALIVAFLVAKIGHVAWYRLGQWKPQFGEPVDDIL